MKFIPIYKWNALIKNMSTTGADQHRLLALITKMAVKFQMFGGETCHVHVKVDHGGTETTDKNNLSSTRANFK